MARESIAQVPNQTAAKRPIVFLLSSDGLAQYCVNLSRWFTHETAAFSTEQCTTRSPFHNFEVLQGGVATQTLGLPIWDAIFFICTYACALKDHLATT